MTVIAAAAMVNARRIWRANQRKKQAKTANSAKMIPFAPSIRFLARLFALNRLQTALDTLAINLLIFTFGRFE